jgi:hypothetical protein
VFFENTSCGTCGNDLGYLESGFGMASKPTKDKWLIAGQDYQYCSNFRHKVCNWLVESNSDSGLCTSCETNRTIPNLDIAGNLEKWRKIEFAKHRLIYTLQKLNLPVKSKEKDPITGLFFDFKGRKVGAAVSAKPIRTGHQDGVITLNINEADPVHREFMKVEMSERYRTLLGHFRHEIGHYYWQFLVFPSEPKLTEFRSFFGDERVSYKNALAHYYKVGAPKDWRNNFISKYASAHPWEDWAETWAHYLHIIDSLETAYSYGVVVSPRTGNSTSLEMKADFDPCYEMNFDRIIASYIPLAAAVNSINRSMGLADLYPFTFNRQVTNKLRSIHRLIK